jgi:hypothetical protein
MARQYYFCWTFQDIIGFLETLRGGAPSVQGVDAEVCSIAATLIYRKYRAYDYSLAPFDTATEGPKLWPGPRERA